jgi:hypothetical protein
MSKEIAIISQFNELSTDRLIEYLNYYKFIPFRFNYEESIQAFDLEINNFNFKSLISNSKFSVNIGNSVNYYRRGNFKYEFLFNRSDVEVDELIAFMNDEIAIINDYIFKSTNFIGSYVDEKNNNKLLNLQFARDCGLKIPATKVTTSKEKATSFHEKYLKIITKPIHNSPQ